MRHPVGAKKRRSLGLLRSPRIKSCLAAAVTAWFSAFAPAAWAADEPEVLRARAAQLASRDDCAGALPLLERAAEMDPSGDQAVTLLKGRCLVSLQQYDAATPLLEQAVAADPNSGEAALALGMSRYHQGNVQAARSELERAEKLLPQRPEPPLYIGLILLAEEESEAAAAQLERSSNLGVDGFEPASSYYAALAHSSAGDAEQADESLRRVERLGAGTPYAARAREALEMAEKRRKGAGPLMRWVSLQSGLDYDSNVSVKSDDVGRPSNIQDSNSDGRAWWDLGLGADLFHKNGWSAGISTNYTGNAYFRETDFNQQYLTGSMWLEKSVGKNTILRIAPEGGLGFLDEDNYLRFVGFRPEVLQEFGTAGVGSLYMRWAYNDFRYRRLDSSLDRDGQDIRFGYDHSVRAGDDTTVRGGLFGRHYIADGSEYDHTGGGGWLGITQSLPWKLTLDVTGSAAYDVYDTASRFVARIGDPPNTNDREDLIGTAGVVLSRPISDWLSVAARWNYLNSDSNTPVFDYDRHVVGAFFTIGFTQPGGLFWGSTP